MENSEDLLKQHLSTEAIANIKNWLTHKKYEAFRMELEGLIENEEWQMLEDSFFKVIEFGTGGRRGTTGVGSNRINRVTIGESAQALCLYAQSIDPDAAAKGIAIACDTRLSSPELSRYVAEVCAANGFTAYIFDSFRATPELSFAVRELGCVAGIVVSASHNPPADNGFKAYWSDGGQLVAPHDKGVMDVVSTIETIDAIDFDEGVASGKIVIIGKDMDDKYIKAVVNEAEGSARDVSIVYSPLHGAGQTNVLPVLQAAGFTDISLVEAQMVPDGNFPTVEGGKPNPEERIANQLAVDQLLAEKADIAITNDPDADRIGVIVRQGDAAVYLNGNQSAVLATEYALRKLKERGELTSKHYIAKTIVTTEMLTAVANHYDVTTYGDMLIGFKYIGELLLNKESTDEIFVIGGEESYGLLKGTYARDKDGAAGALPLAEYAAELKADGKTLYDRLIELFGEYGVFSERLDSVSYLGATGFQKMQSIMSQVRANPPQTVGGEAVTAVIDYSTAKKTNLSDGSVQDVPININGNVIVLEFGDARRRVTVRPSGTEPKLKLYVQWYEDAEQPTNIDALKAQNDALAVKLEQLSKELESLLLQ